MHWRTNKVDQLRQFQSNFDVHPFRGVEYRSDDLAVSPPPQQLVIKSLGVLVRHACLPTNDDAEQEETEKASQPDALDGHTDHPS